MINLTDSIIRRIRAKGRGGVYTARDFLDFGSRAAVDKALSRLTARGQIRRISRGVYDYPLISNNLGPLSPLPETVAGAVARGTNSELQISGAHAANKLGLSTQVAARVVFLTDGKSRQLRIGNQVIEFRHASPGKMATAGTPSGTILQALRHIGHHNIDAKAIDKLKRVLSAKDKSALKKDVNNAPDWLRPIIEMIAT